MALTVQGFFNGVGPANPMTATGLPKIYFSWYINGAPANVAFTNPLGVKYNCTTGNVASFDLTNNQPTIGGTFALTPASPCTVGQTPPAITVAMLSNCNLNGNGTTLLPAISGMPTIVNGFPDPYNAGGSHAGVPDPIPTPSPTAASTSPTTAAPTASSQATNAPAKLENVLTPDQVNYLLIAVGVVGAGLVGAGIFVAVKKHKRGVAQQVTSIML